jgi:heptosyltransferase-2
MRYGLLNDARKLNKLFLRKTVEQFAALSLPKGSPINCDKIPKPRLSPVSPELILQRLRLPTPHQPVLALCPGAEYGPAKQWPIEYFAEVAKQRIAEGWQVWVLGSPKDAGIGLRIQTLAGAGCINLCGQTHLVDAIDLLALTRAVVTNDSGLMHVAAALEKPLIALFGSSNPLMTPPLSNQADILYLRLKCSPCFARTCRYQHLKCLKDITPAQVLEKLRAMV